MKTVLYGRYSKGSEKTVTTTPPALAVNTYPANAKSFELQGRSLALNQQIYQMYNTIDPSLTGLTVTFNNGLLSVSGTADVTLSIKLLDNNDLVANHIYYFNAPTGASTSGYRLYFATSGDSYTTDSIITWTTGKGSFNIRVNGGTSTGFSYYPQFIDLTQIFGAGFEPTTVDQLKSIIDLDKYIPYNPGTFIHNNATYEVNKWNQLIKNGDFSQGTANWASVDTNKGTIAVSNGELTYTVATVGTSYTNGFYTSCTPSLNHKYLVTGHFKSSSSTIKLGYDILNVTAISSGTYTLSPSYQTISFIITTVNTGSSMVVFCTRANAQVGDTITAKDINLIDLTDIFGAGKEPSTVNECKLRFLSMGIDITKYQRYSPLGGQYCGYRNIWDEEWELGDFNATTGVKESGSRIINADYIPVLSNTNYYVNNTNVITVYYYDSNKTFLGYNNPSSGCFESLPNSAYINFRCSTTYGTTYKNDISIYQVSNKVDLGFNIWDKNFTSGSIQSSTGDFVADSSRVRSGYIPIKPNSTYYAMIKESTTESGVEVVCFYNSSFTYLGSSSHVEYVNRKTFTTPANAAYMAFRCTVAFKDMSFCFNESQPDTTKSPHNGDYRPYLMLRGIGSDFNVWDEEWEVGAIDASTGENVVSSVRIRSKNFILVSPNTLYYPYQFNGTASFVMCWYDKNKNFISSNWYTFSSYQIRTPENCYYIRFSTAVAYGTIYKNDICINLSQPQTTINPHNGQYVPHLFDTYDSMSGILTRRIGVVDLGTLNFVYDSTYAYWEVAITGFALPPNIDTKGNISHPIYENRVTAGFSATGNNGITLVMTGYLRVKTTSSSVRPSGILLYELNAYQVFTPIQYSVVDLGSLSWGYVESNRYRALIPSDMKVIAENAMPNWRCSSKTPCPATTNLSNVQNGICLYNPGNANYLYTYASSSSAATPTGVLTYQNNTPYKFGVVDMGSLSWTRVDVTGSGGYVFSTPATPLQMYKQSDNLWCSGYTTGHYNGTGSTIYNYGNKIIAQHSPSGEFNIYVRDDSYTSASSFTNAVKGKILTYELSDSISQTTIAQPISFVAGKLGKQYGVVDLGSLAYAYQSTYHYFYTNLTTGTVLNAQYNVHPLLYSSRYSSVETEYTASSNIPDKSITFLRDGNPQEGSTAQYLRINDFAFTDATAFKNSLQGQYLIYKLADSATNPTYATAGNLIQKTKGDVGDVDFNLKYNTLLNENRFLISYNMGTPQSPDKRLINVGGILNA